MRQFAMLALAASLAACASAPPPPAVDERTRGAIKQLTDIVGKQPENLPYTYVLATYHDRAYEPAEVVKWLTALDERGWDLGVAAHEFKNSRKSRAFRAVEAKLNARQASVARAERAFALQGRRDLVPEGIAWDPVDDVFYVSGIYRRNVIRVDRKGNVTEFVREAQDGMLGGLGVKVDAKRRMLWVISSTTPEMRGYEEGKDASMLAAYDLRDGRLLRKVEATPAILNDLALLSDGSLFATDMGRHKVVRLAPDATAFEIWAEGLGFPNGIALSEDEKSLYVADFSGLTKFDTATKERTKVTTERWMGGIDGLSWHRGSLIGIQNAIGRARVVRIDPATGRVELLESKNALFELPTTGAVAGDDYWFIANPGLRSFNEDHTIWAWDKLQDPVMLRISLR
jgi:sugar lactone lactonase YvrE